jgi:lysozyme family protein
MKKTLANLRSNYTVLWQTMQVNAIRQDAIDYEVKKMLFSQAAYKEIETTTDVPWRYIAICHNLECSSNFKLHLHNGDPLTARTVNVPKGRPLAGMPPFTWKFSAVDALQQKGLNATTDWSIEGILFQFERFNGFGYRNLEKPINSPYLWSFTNHYVTGKFGSDGNYNSKLVSKQVGAAILLKELLKH